MNPEIRLERALYRAPDWFARIIAESKHSHAQCVGGLVFVWAGDAPPAVYNDHSKEWSFSPNSDRCPRTLEMDFGVKITYKKIKRRNLP